MGLSESILNRSIQCFSDICEDVDCEIESGCCKTHYTNSPRRHNSKESVASDNENNINK
jgi:hypothetical protein